MRKGIKTIKKALGYGRFLNRYSGFKNKNEAQKFANDARIENKKLQPIRGGEDDVCVRVIKRKEGWVVDEFDNPRSTSKRKIRREIEHTYGGRVH